MIYIAASKHWIINDIDHIEYIELVPFNLPRRNLTKFFQSISSIPCWWSVKARTRLYQIQIIESWVLNTSWSYRCKCKFLDFFAFLCKLDC